MMPKVSDMRISHIEGGSKVTNDILLHLGRSEQFRLGVFALEERLCFDFSPVCLTISRV